MKNILVIPFYKNEHYIDNFVKYFADFPDEYDLFQKICIFNDSPESLGSERLAERCAFAKFEYIKNEKNLGFLKTVNRGFAIAKDFDANLVVLNSDTLPYKNSFYELLRCFEIDSMLGCVAPRSNNATICNLFAAPVYIDGQDDLVDVCKIFEESKKYVPEVSYAPVTNGFCIAIRSSVLKAFQGYSDEFDPGYEEENDYCLRVSTYGFRIGISNHSFVAHLEGKSFGLNHGRDELKRKNHQLLLSKYPGYPKLLEMYSFEYSKKSYDLILTALRRGKQEIFVDASNLGAYHNGTNKLIVECVRALASLNYKVNLVANETAFLFHGLDGQFGVRRINFPPSEDVYLIGLRIGQPFSHGDLLGVPCASIFAINIFFDTIAIDCPQIYIENPEIYGLWALLDSLYTHISFISEHSRVQFLRKFSIAKSDRKCSNLIPRIMEVNPLETGSKEENQIQGRYALVVGNKFSHKGIAIALNELPRVAGLRYVVLSADVDLLNIRDDIELLPVGQISDSKMKSLYSNCDFVVFPSFAEGYGFPLIEALTYQKKIYLRDIECYREIEEGLDDCYRKLITYTDDFSNISTENVGLDFSGAADIKEYYSEYIGKIVKQSLNSNDAKQIFHLLERRLQLMALVTYSDGIQTILYRKSINFYRKLYLLKFARPFLRFVKRVALKMNLIQKKLMVN